MIRETVRFDTLADLDRMLATATKLVRTRDRLALVFEVQPDAAAPLFGFAVRSWLRRRAPELRARVDSLELGMPTWRSAIYMRLEMFATRPPIRVTVRRR